MEAASSSGRRWDEDDGDTAGIDIEALITLRLDLRHWCLGFSGSKFSRVTDSLVLIDGNETSVNEEEDAIDDLRRDYAIMENSNNGDGFRVCEDVVMPRHRCLSDNLMENFHCTPKVVRYNKSATNVIGIILNIRCHFSQLVGPIFIGLLFFIFFWKT